MPLKVWPLQLHGCTPPGGTRVSICFLPDAFSQVPPANGHEALEQCFVGVLTGYGHTMQPDKQHPVAMLLVALDACPLLLDGMDVGLGELPAIRKLLPLLRPQMPGSQSPQHRVELLRFLPMVLLKGQVLPRGIPGVPAQHVILWGRSQKCSCHPGGHPCQALPREPGWGTGIITGLGFLVSYSVPCFDL